MVIKHQIKGYENFIKFIENLKPDEPTYVLFMGSKSKDGDSWCPDCVVAHPFIERGIKSASETCQYIVVEVGNRSFWKDKECPFRTDSKIRITALPTLVKWGTEKRLQGEELLNSDLIEMLVAEDIE